ncbi:MAG: M20/M25/M40 family metallo-hydrolase, partial [Phycisphaerales bacterium]|nr:M20/M25/M40 family metallo-hydrolase [Phycisphaerales bacterium]
RGTTDMKGFVALAVLALRAAASRRLTRPLALVLTHNEEVGSLGAQALVRDLPREAVLPRATIVGEPTSLGAVRMHKGHLKIRFTIRGRAAHSGTPHLGRSAIEPAGRLVVALAALRREFESVHTDTSGYFAETPFPVINIGRIRGGDAVNVVPDRCEVEIGVRLLPGMTAGPCIERLEAVARDATGMTRLEAEVINDNPSMLLPESAAIHRAALEILGQTESRGVSFASDAGILSRDLDMYCILWGPGSMDVAHQPDEHLDLDELERAGQILETFINHFCSN